MEVKIELVKTKKARTVGASGLSLWDEKTILIYVIVSAFDTLLPEPGRNHMLPKHLPLLPTKGSKCSICGWSYV